jgi:hypothetical protein
MVEDKDNILRSKPRETPLHYGKDRKNIKAVKKA